MPVYTAEEVATAPIEKGGLGVSLPLVRQVVDWVCSPSKKQELLQQYQQQQEEESQIHDQLLAGEVLNDSMAASAMVVAAAAAAAASASAAVSKKCPYSAVAKNPAVPYVFQMPLHYPRYTKAHYEAMPEWQIDRLLEEYGLPPKAMGSLENKREYAIGAFLWRA